MRHWFAVRAAKFALFAVLAFAVLGVLVMILWNALIPDIFRGPTVTFWQAVGLLLLSHILVRGFGGRWHGGWKHARWRQRMEEKMAGMTPEEREKFRAEWRRHCGWHPPEKEAEKQPGN